MPFREQFYPASSLSKYGTSSESSIMRLDEKPLSQKAENFGLPLSKKPGEKIESLVEAMRPQAAESMAGKSEIGTKLAIGSPSEALRTEALDTTAQATKAAEPAKAASDMGYGSAGIMAGGQLLGSLGKAISEAGVQRMQAEAESVKGFGKSRQEAMQKSAAGKYAALAQLISAYRSAMR